MNAMIQINNISKYFGEKTALKNIHLNLEGGKIVGILGENGAGKTTLLKILAGLLRPDTGNVSIENIPVRICNSFSCFLHARLHSFISLDESERSSLLL